MTSTRTITVSGMSCAHCEETVEDALLAVSGVESAEADRESESATVEGDTDVSDLVAAVDDAGYDASS
ncbi:heavy-metal-associated domain-containing protein [Halobellus rarus]|uniref:Heavy-metal-associated domain-containing protein n=1 Tax=Halobellus rarus TaxID=1126237 RepID=A0ABD6CPY4_9EURY|nr:heavy metal-associated domain-containing protein [Halobellus rarus]